jgi:CRISPR-associated endonuclease Csy4
MNAYLDLRLLPDPEFPATILMNALFNKLHRGLVEHGGQCIGISFPEFGERPDLGRRLRLHGKAGELEKLMALNWLSGMRDHVASSAIMNVPANVKYRIVRRVQAKSSPERQRRRLMARKGLNDRQAQQAIPDSTAQRLNLPSITLSSRSTGQQFQLFIEHLPLKEQAQAGLFSTYGLSTTATVPWF